MKCSKLKILTTPCYFALTNIPEMQKCLLDNPNGVLEKWIVQHASLNKIYDDAVNCIRIITLRSDGVCSVVAANITFGFNTCIANASQECLVCIPNLLTGKIQTDAEDINGNVYYKHPQSGIVFRDFQIPYWKEIISMCVDAADVIPEVGYVGWDVAVTPNGPVIIEGNTTPGYKFFQLRGTTSEGNKKIYKKAMCRR